MDTHSTPPASGSSSLSDLAERKRALLDHKDELNAVLSDVNKELGRIDGELLARMQADGLDKLTAAGISLSIGEVWNVTIPDDKWEDFRREMVEAGHGYVMHRQVSSSKFMELLDSGFTPPEYVKTEAFKRLNHRRSGG